MPKKKQPAEQVNDSIESPTVSSYEAAMEAAKDMMPAREVLLGEENPAEEQQTKEGQEDNSQEDLEEEQIPYEPKGYQQEEDKSKPKDEVKYSRSEQEAMKQGWRPQEEYQGDPEEWKDAKSFVEHGHIIELRKQVSELTNVISNQQQALQLISGDVMDRSKQRLDVLKEEKREAIMAGDVEKTEQYEDMIKKLESGQQQQQIPQNQQNNYNSQANNQQQQQSQQQNPASPELTEFMDRNKEWFDPQAKNVNFHMKVANIIYDEIKEKEPFLSERETLYKVETMVRDKFFPTKQPSSRPSAVEQGTPYKKGQNKDFGYDDLPEKIWDPVLQKEFNPKEVLDGFMENANNYLKKAKHKPKLDHDKNWAAKQLQSGYLHAK